MKIVSVNGRQYRLPNGLNEFQQKLYIHLINWKRENITAKSGINGGIEYDTFLPEEFKDKYPILYPDILQKFKEHQQKFPFRIHQFFNHIASSQAACANLFLPVLLHPNADDVLKQLKPDFAALARNEFDNGFRMEFWDESCNSLNDHSETSGTDSDIAIAYYSHSKELCLWLIEHKLTEAEFTTCGGFKSKGRIARHNCEKTFAEILKDKDTCYYHSAKKFKYWDITEKNAEFFANHNRYSSCPFKDGLNQLWRNQLLALSIENDSRQKFSQVFFSVVRHPLNKSLDVSIEEYKKLIGNNSKFSVFTSHEVIEAAQGLNESELNKWIVWYKKLYNI
jgi:hypothetical protein